MERLRAMDDSGLMLSVGGGAIGALATLAGSWLRARANSRRIEPQPLEVAVAPAYADRVRNDNDHNAVFLRLAAVEQKTAATAARLSQIERGIGRIEDKIDKLILHEAHVGEAGN